MSNGTLDPLRRLRIRFAWWNVQSFAHFDENRVGQGRWPSYPQQYAAKCELVDGVVISLVKEHGPLDVVGLAEITEVAAKDLRNRLFPDHEVESLNLFSKYPFQVAILFPRTGDFRSQPPIVTPFMPRTTRPMAVVDFIDTEHRIRFIACHWTARTQDNESRVLRTEIAKHLRRCVFEYLHEAERGVTRHAVVMGDLNAEPFDEEIVLGLEATRSRRRSRSREHYSDGDVQRVRMYNCAWRLLGESSPHRGGVASESSVAGTYYHTANSAWRTFDQVLVTGSLLGKYTG